MKILLLSDSHGHVDRIEQIAASCPPIRLIVFCGDMDADLTAITNLFPDTPCLAVQGNNEYTCNRPFSLIDEENGHRIYVTHGHKERVKSGYERLVSVAKVNQCDTVFFGHTHQQTDITIDGVHLINPGAVSGMYGSYTIVDVTEQAVQVQFFVL
ncbi:MAG: YfcE family phosphodiesterase [Ruminococcaceae bacterium]|nr:YfcE family phosphodiesterase [Oscillospiraceae bacterium]